MQNRPQKHCRNRQGRGLKSSRQSRKSTNSNPGIKKNNSVPNSPHKPTPSINGKVPALKAHLFYAGYRYTDILHSQDPTHQFLTLDITNISIMCDLNCLLQGHSLVCAKVMKAGKCCLGQPDCLNTIVNKGRKGRKDGKDNICHRDKVENSSSVLIRCSDESEDEKLVTDVDSYSANDLQNEHSYLIVSGCVIYSTCRWSSQLIMLESNYRLTNSKAFVLSHLYCLPSLLLLPIFVVNVCSHFLT